MRLGLTTSFGMTILLLAATVSCNGPSVTDSSTTAYPPLRASAPSATPSTSAQPTISTASRFQIDIPLLEGTTQVTGRGPANMPIFIMNVTYVGQELGRTTISSDGKFVAGVTPPLNRGDRVGIAAGPFEKPIAEDESFLNQLFELRGPGYIYIPTVAYFYDSAIVQPKR